MDEIYFISRVVYYSLSSLFFSVSISQHLRFIIRIFFLRGHFFFLSPYSHSKEEKKYECHEEWKIPSFFIIIISNLIFKSDCDKISLNMRNILFTLNESAPFNAHFIFENSTAKSNTCKQTRLETGARESEKSTEGGYSKKKKKRQNHKRKKKKKHRVRAYIFYVLARECLMKASTFSSSMPNTRPNRYVTAL